MLKCLIVAVDSRNGIGIHGDLPWHIAEDLKYFKATTLGCPVIMGRKTYDSLPFKPLKGRLNIVLSRNCGEIPGAVVCSSLEEAYLEAGKSGCDKCFVIGGAAVYAQALGDMDRLYITHVNTEVKGADAFFPEINPNDWDVISRSETHTDPGTGFQFEFVVYERNLR